MVSPRTTSRAKSRHQPHLPGSHELIILYSVPASFERHPKYFSSKYRVCYLDGKLTVSHLVKKCRFVYGIQILKGSSFRDVTL